jgi:hypothetical protein
MKTRTDRFLLSSQPQNCVTQFSILSLNEFILITLLGVIACVILGYYLGQDIGPDLTHYHFYVAYAALHPERLQLDILPAGIQSYLNPYIYMPLYYLYRLFSPPVVGLIYSAVHGFSLVIIYIISRLLLEDWSLFSARCMSLCCAVFGMMNPFFIGMLGSSFSDNLTAPVILAAVALMLFARFPKQTITAFKFYISIILAGVLLGITVGFKLVNCMYVVGLIPAWLVSFRGKTRDFMGAFMLLISVGLGFLWVNGVWMWRIYTIFHNPLFPFYNNIFHSSMIGHIWTNVPAKAAAHSIRDFFVYPFQWARGIPSPTEWLFYDARYAVIYVLAGCAGVIGVIKLFSRTKTHRVVLNYQKIVGNAPIAVKRYLKRRWCFLAVWSFFCYLFWIDQFGAMRYLMPITLLTGCIMLVCLLKIIPYRKIAITCWLLLAVVLLLMMRSVYFGRLPWKKAWYPVSIPAKLMNLQHALYMTDPSMSFNHPFLPKTSHFINLGYLVFNDGLSKKAHHMIANHQGALRTITLMPIDGSFFDQLQKFGLRKDPKDCVNFTAGDGYYFFQSCRLEKMTQNSTLPALPDYVVIHLNQSNLDQYSPWLNFTRGFYMPELNGMWTKGKRAEIHLAGNLPKKFRLHIQAAAVMGENQHLPFTLTVGDQKQVIYFNDKMNVQAEFDLHDQKVNVLMMTVPAPISPHTVDASKTDTRDLGVLIKRIVIESVIKG